NPATITRILLSHFNWDKEKLMERYFDGNVDKLFSECHVINPSKTLTTRPMSTRSSAQDLPCQICYLNHPNSVRRIALSGWRPEAQRFGVVVSKGMGFCFPQYFTGLECGHKFCMQCWGDYLTTKIMEEGMGQ
ncbi:unnamed protein product, partial [Coregonus sp. 'balchen']